MKDAIATYLGQSCAALLAVILLAAFNVSAAADIRIEPLILDEENPDRTKFGQLRWRGGISIIGSDRRFGGISALHVNASGRSLLAITDRGNWLQASLDYRNGHLHAMRDIQLSPLRDLQGRPLSGRHADSESLAKTDEGFIVSFERHHRLWRYARKPIASKKAPVALASPRDFNGLPDNGGIEAMTQLCDGSLLAVAEKSIERRETVSAWIRSGKKWQSLAYRTKAGLRPTGAATLPNCDIIFVERSFSFLAGLDIRVSLVPAASIKPGAVLEPVELAQFSDPLNIDNFEGISARRTPSGNTLIYLVSDDNFSAIQRTLLLMFQLELPR